MKSSINRVDPLSIVELIHAVPLGSATWTQVLEQVARATGSRAATMVIQDRTSGELAGFHEHGIPAERGEVYAEHYIYNDPRIEYAVQHRHKLTICDYDFITESQMDRHEYYAEFLAEGDFRYMGAVHLRELEADGEFRSFTVQRSPREGHPTPTQVELLVRLAPHVVQAARLERNLAVYDLQESLFDEFSRRLDAGILVCDAGADVVWRNDAAADYIGTGKPLHVHRGGLHAHAPAWTRYLRAALAEACRALDGGPEAGRAMRLPGGDDGRSTDVLISPLPVRDISGTLLMPRSKTYALVLLRRSPSKVSLPAVVLQQLYGLTPAEARLTADLAAGYSTAEVAERMRITRDTLRSYLKQVFMKTGARRQAELIAMVLNSPAIFAKGLDP
ncbi:MAG TPA: helix-turn-helix transcriptional regulator [Arenicellales bacterium]|nr:helix-turn-helix transcriptional regulator [Arenicellales bacterium]